MVTLWVAASATLEPGPSRQRSNGCSEAIGSVGRGAAWQRSFSLLLGAHTGLLSVDAPATPETERHRVAQTRPLRQRPTYSSPPYGKMIWAANAAAITE